MVTKAKVWLLVVVTVAALTWGAWASFPFEPAYAAGVNGCEAVGTVGNVIIAKCIDEKTGDEVWANSAGMMATEP